MKDQTNSIRVFNGYGEGAYTYYPVLIIGAGISGIAMGCRLKEVLGFDQFRVFERQSGIGGTWWVNRYPGVACDIPALFYSFSFSPNHGWTSLHPGGSEILQYLHNVCSKYQLLNNIQCDTDVREVIWNEGLELWEVTICHMVPGTGDRSCKEREDLMREHGRGAIYLKEEKVRAKIVCSCAGGLVEPNSWPKNVPGQDQFQGAIFHSARWNFNIDLDGKDVVVVGTGCSAAQFVPQLIKKPYNVKSVTQVMRSPPWIVPRPVPPGGQDAWEKSSSWWFSNFPFLGRLSRWAMFLALEAQWFELFPQSSRAFRGRKKREHKLLRHMRKAVPERYWEMLTPSYSVGCKRQIFDAHWFQSLNEPNIRLTTKPLRSVQNHGVTLGPAYPPIEKTHGVLDNEEERVPADVIILANGFDTVTWLAPTKIVGRHATVLQEEWDRRGGPQAYLGNAIDGFPNFFIVFGPNTATGHTSAILASENMINYTLSFVRLILRGHVRTCEVKAESQSAWTNQIQNALKDTVFQTGGCHSYYKSQTTDRNATVYPYSQIDFTLRCMFPKWSDWDIQYTRKGLIRMRVKKTLQVLALIILAIYAFSIREAPIVGLMATLSTIRSYLRQVLLTAAKWIQSTLE